MDEALSTVHKAMAMAATEVNEDKVAMVTYGFRINNEDLVEIKKACEARGITPSDFLRHCCLAFLEDYRKGI